MTINLESAQAKSSSPYLNEADDPVEQDETKCQCGNEKKWSQKLCPECQAEYAEFRADQAEDI